MKFKIYLLFAGIFISCSIKESKPIDIISLAASPEGMVYIPAGSFTMGGKSDQAAKDEFPRHQVNVSQFFMDATEVSNDQYKEFIDATGYVTIAERKVDWEEMKLELPPGTPKPGDDILEPGSMVFHPTDGPVPLDDFSIWWVWTHGADWKHPSGPNSNLDGLENHPVVHIAWEDAIAYAKWKGKRLPTEAEWEWASMGGQSDVKYPWGNESVEKAFDKANFWQGFFPYQNLVKDGFTGTANVKSFPPNGYGLFDMAGNVWEWCQDKYHHQAYALNDPNSISSNPTGPNKSFDPSQPYSEQYVIRGGSFLCNDSYCSGYRVARRMKSTKDSGFNHTGFRCVKDI